MLASRVSYLKQIVLSRTISTAFQASTSITFKLKNRQCSTVQQDESTSLVKAVTDGKSLTLHCQNAGRDVRFHHVWLRHHCPCEACLDPETKQRMIDMALIPGDVQPKEVKVDSNKLNIVWDDGHQTSYSMSWLQQNAYHDFTKGKANRGFGSIANESEMLLWNKEIITSNPPPEYNYIDLQNNDDIVEEALNGIFRYGFIFVNETPTDDESLANICKRIGGVIYDNLYGRVYVLETNVFTKPDIVFAPISLSGHTDYVYYSEPAAMHAVHIPHHDGTGGETLLIDGFWAAKTLYKEDPEAYKSLTSTEVPFHWTTEEHRIHVHGPLLELDPFSQELMRLRYNNTRVSPFVNMNMTFDEMEQFYRAVRLFGSILRRPENELWFKLVPGRVIVMDNRRTLHGRSAITGSRILKGCFVGIDDYMGKWRASNMKSQL